MQVNKISNKNNINFRITTETVRRANQTLIERGKLAKLQGLNLAEYNALHKDDYVLKIENKTIDIYEMTKKILADKEKVRKAFGEAWNKVIGQNL